MILDLRWDMARSSRPSACQKGSPPPPANMLPMFVASLGIDCLSSWRMPLTDLGTWRRSQCDVPLLVQISITWRHDIDFRRLGTLHDPCASKPGRGSDCCSMHNHALRQERALVDNECQSVSFTTNTDYEKSQSGHLCADCHVRQCHRQTGIVSQHHGHCLCCWFRIYCCCCCLPRCL